MSAKLNQQLGAFTKSFPSFQYVQSKLKSKVHHAYFVTMFQYFRVFKGTGSKAFIGWCGQQQ